MTTAKKSRSQANAQFYVTQRDLMRTPKGRSKTDWLFAGIFLILAGLVFFAAVSGIGVAKWILGLWPLLMLIMGVAGVMGFAIERKPRSPVWGMLLIFLGVLFGAGRLHSDLNAIQVYGRYWILLLIVFAAVELVRYYSHRQSEGAPPRLLTFGKAFLVLFIVSTGILAGRVTTNDSVLGSIKLPWFFNNLRDSFIGETYTFTDEPVTIADIKPNSHVSITNNYGDVKITGGSATAKATLTQGIRSWRREDAEQIANQLNVVVTKNADGDYVITTNRNDIYYPNFRTDMQIDLPATAVVTVTNSYGVIKASNLQNGLIIKSNYGDADVTNITGNTTFNLSYANVSAQNMQGNVTVTGAKGVKLSNIHGAVDVTAGREAVDLRQISGIVKVEAVSASINAQDIEDRAFFKTQHNSVKVARATDVTIEAPHSDVSASNIQGDLKIASTHSNIKASNISGTFTVEAEHSNISAEEIQSDVKINTSHGDVALKNFHENVDIETSYDSVTLTSSGQIEGTITVNNSHGKINVVLPQTANYTLDAESQNGRIKTSDLNEISQTERGKLYQVSGTGVPTIKLRTSYQNIFVQVGGTRQIPTPGFVKPATF